jgi:hypothetical protein
MKSVGPIPHAGEASRSRRRMGPQLRQPRRYKWAWPRYDNDPWDAFTRDLDLPLGRERRPVRERDRVYEITRSTRAEGRLALGGRASGNTGRTRNVRSVTGSCQGSCRWDLPRRMVSIAARSRACGARDSMSARPLRRCGSANGKSSCRSWCLARFSGDTPPSSRRRRSRHLRVCRSGLDPSQHPRARDPWRIR